MNLSVSRPSMDADDDEEQRQQRPWPGHHGETRVMSLGDRMSRLVSRRSGAACSLCRWRKVRCDGDKGRSCSNCVFEKIECVVPPRQGRKRANLRKPYPGPSTSSTNTGATGTSGPVKSPPNRNASIAHTGHTDQSHRLITSPSRATGIEGGEGISRHGDEDMTDSPTTSRPKEVNEFNWFAAAAQSVPSPRSRRGSTELPPSGISLADASTPAQGDALPPWLKPLPAHLSSEDVDYIRRKGALIVPEPNLRDDLLKNYIEFVHPSLPLLDLVAFQASLQDPARHGPVSLLLFHAVMFTSTSWANIKLVRSLGYWTRADIRRAYYKRFKVLYDLSYERDRLVVVQALILATLWWDGPSEQKDGYYYCSVALTVARSIGLHRDVHNQFLPPATRRLRRRVWWSFLMRDTLASLGSNHSPRTKDSDFTVPELTLDDFDIQSPASPGTPWAVARDVNSQSQIALIFIWQSKLCRIMSHILQLAYDENHMGHTGILYPRHDSDAIGDTCAESQSPSALTLERLKSCEEDLSQWRKSVPENVLHESPLPMVDAPHELAPYVHRALLSMLYFVAIFSVHRPCIKASGLSKTTGIFGDEQALSPHQNMRYAAACGNKIVMELYQSDLMRHLPAVGISCLLVISFSHVYDLQSDQEARREGTRRLEECKLALGEMAEALPAAEWAGKFLTTAAAYVTRISTMRHKASSSDQTVVPVEGNQNIRDSHRGTLIGGVQINNPQDVNERGSISAPNGSDPLQELMLPDWQRAPEMASMETNHRIAPNRPLLLPEGSVDYPNFTDLWLSEINDLFEYT